MVTPAVSYKIVVIVLFCFYDYVGFCYARARTTLRLLSSTAPLDLPARLCGSPVWNTTHSSGTYQLPVYVALEGVPVRGLLCMT